MRRISPNVFCDFADPIRSEHFSAASLERHGVSLALAQKISPNPCRGINLANRVEQNKLVLIEAYRQITTSVDELRAITPAAEWLIDNFHLVEEQLRDIKEQMPPEYYNELPKLSIGHLTGYPRVYGIAWAYVAHNESLFDADLIKRFVKSYQTVQPLTIGELWAISITLRIIMIENLARISARIVGAQIGQKKADLMADEILGLSNIKHDILATRTIDQILKKLKDDDKKQLPLQSGFAVQLIQRLRFQDSKVMPVLKWLDERLAASGLVADGIVPEEHNRQSVANATVRNIITSMRLMSAFDWHTFFEEVSLVDEIFRADPLYSKMDFITRDRYRHGLEEIALGAKIPEISVAASVFKKTDFGQYLISSGRYVFEKEIGFKTKISKRLLRFYIYHREVIYIGSIFVFTLILLFLVFKSSQFFVFYSPISIILAFLGVFPASEIAIAFVNYFTVRFLGPRHIPRLKLSDGIPAHLKTFVVVPTLFDNDNEIANQVKELEVHYLSNPDGAVYLALLSDWPDAENEYMADDEKMLSIAIENLNDLNKKYGPAPDGNSRFFIFHRKRQWNPFEQKWIGWERKRGKLHEFNRLLRGAMDTSFIRLPEFPAKIPTDIIYVITLDADTKMPKGAVAQLVGAMAHPLNRPIFDLKLNRVIEGYGVLQPRITPSLPGNKDSSFFQRISAAPGGVDPYSSSVSDVYQDLFGEGSYSGKGIYNIDVFEKALEGRIPENKILSHDLFEGNFARCGYLSDVEFFEDFPSHISVAMARIHRWTRGDWQLLPWILGREGRAISVVGRLKMIDNLRRSLVAPMTLFLFVALFCIPRINIRSWIILNLVSLALPSLLPFVSEIISFKKNIFIGQRLRSLSEDLFLVFHRFLFNIILLPHQAKIYLDAIGKALYRQIISKHNLLEWTTSQTSKNSVSLTLKSFLVTMIFDEIFLLLLIALLSINSKKLAVALPFLVLWILSPLVAYLASLPPSNEKIRPLEKEDISLLKNSARRIWRFFTTFVTEEENYLPPDNFQEDPKAVIAHRSSPTNFGLYLLSIIAARDFGWIGVIEMVTRLQNTINTLKKLPRHQGHFFNWYNTIDCKALMPRYISSVDNGNLAGHLLVVAQALEEIEKSPIPSCRVLHKGLCSDSLRLLRETLLLSKSSDKKRNLTVNQAQLFIISDELEKLLSFPLDNTWPEILKTTDTLVDLAKTFADERGEIQKSEILNWAKLIDTEIKSHIKDLSLQSSDGAIKIIATTKELAATCRNICYEMDFNFLYNHSKKLFSIGYRMSDGLLDDSYYDLLASEARLLSFVAIAKGDISSKHWFRLGRALTRVERGAALISWSGSIFEYLMPSLVMNTPAQTLLGQTCRLVVKKQILYGAEKGVPWGISESTYNERDLHLTYQYKAFGVPGMGLKRGIENDLVIAPYATILAAMYAPNDAVKNLRNLSFAYGMYGFYDAVDFTKQRIPQNANSSVVKTYMAHHQGMSLIAIANVLLHGIFRKRFHREPIVQATELLLQERIPRNVVIEKTRLKPSEVEHIHDKNEIITRRYFSADQLVPPTNLLSNGNYSVMMTAAGSGYSRFRDISVTRWREDVTRDHYGSYIFLRRTGPKRESNKIWSAGYLPTSIKADQYEVIFAEDRVKISRKDDEITSNLEIFVSPEDNAEIRRLSLTNNGSTIIEIEVTSYAEVVLNIYASDIAHPAFSNLFIQTEYAKEITSLLATRRPRSSNESPLWLAHVISTDSNAIGEIEYETDRANFIGRGRSISNPVSIFDGKPLSNTVGPVLDPMLALRTRVRILPGTTAKVTYSTAIALSKDEILKLADKLRDNSTFERISNLAWTQAQVSLHYLGIEHHEAHLFQELANRFIYLDFSLRSSGEILKRNKKDVSALWAYGISGDNPIVLVRVGDIEKLAIIRQLLRAHEYWGTKGLVVDLIILNEKSVSYSQELQKAIETMVQGSVITSGSYLPQTKGKVFVLRAEILSKEDQNLLQAAARAILVADHGSLAEQVKRRVIANTRPVKSIQSKFVSFEIPFLKRYFLSGPVPVKLNLPSLDFFNGLGGFFQQGKEYIIHLKKNQQTPAPWINVIANPQFGFQVSESGAGYTWSLNSRENQITPWSNDPVCDPSGECFYISDQDSGKLWSPTASPIRIEEAEYITHHGQGYSRFETINDGIYSDLTQFVHWEAPIKVSKLILNNFSKEKRNLSVIGYIEWVLGFSRITCAPYIITELLETKILQNDTQIVLAHNPFSRDFGKRISFATFLGGNDAITCDRTEFLGRNGNISKPAAIFSNSKIGAGLDPCSAIKKNIFLRPGQSITIVFLLGQTDNRAEIQTILEKIVKGKEDLSGIDLALLEVQEKWNDLLTQIQVETPDLAMNIMLNRWLLYQTIVCRLWARSAFYQAGGAYGFRDQLQDSLALVWADPSTTRAQIIRASSRQFIEGDVQHWWHTSLGQGVRTHFSDDLLWLPFVVAHYLKVTEDNSVLNEQVSFLEGPLLKQDQEDSFYVPDISKEVGSVYEHCARAIDHSLAVGVGVHGLPLMGSGDWNDGMNRVGIGGKGESVWLAWFIYANLVSFVKIAQTRCSKQEDGRAQRWHQYAENLKATIEKNAWDGAWYRRAFFDDGTPLGSSSNSECKIDSIAQTWGVISGASDSPQMREHVEQAMKSVEEFLIKPHDNIILLFSPPFDQTIRDPGYIKGYLPGVRENGGHYSHAGIWCIYAYAGLGKGQQAVELFSMLNPINHSSTRAKVHRYKVEPYVLSADIYSMPPYVGRGGWTWYTGSSAWMYRAGIESILGLRLTGNKLQIEPHIHPEWKKYKIHYRYYQTDYEIEVKNPNGLSNKKIDCDEANYPTIFLINDKVKHYIKLQL
ncbi:MAG: hypothetical protein A2504_12405 [Bdellovibrionales bacterium RIFOXYD12_FULL_39_22]|nr:MAG: hypothetical protein A2385_15895 [Bdellovibrionales bacterium RIFOXYB1_FULL_39_21]OFZ40684.1 MAG: hypothetical protein A2485_04550 [Bdellovibrionales bacterium RIFOXYC12_FULL_39_17]OFZ49718.1 MAG: hypothetical protein A2404_01530 [Bdellovibrionales bacterium RIFOXYC1_FULL_39_130]OFZ77266.1 MAG: hypothetical protein A2560_11750 [Bdellovibrionales bacterium RIFOXYD1_FULL_39_84]OFZ91778.1 MAG: hypothetical protein A2504_12405 [Bdellovibrionales bacterium RIFOXYD12_FULL_39_22]HLE13092.1 gl